MIREIIIENISAVEEQDEINRIVGVDAQGKILKVFVRFPDVVKDRTDVNLKILTKEGEEIINVSNKDDKRAVYYPRVSIEAGKYKENVLGSENQDYFYFINGLLMSIKMENPKFKGLIIEKIKIIYEAL